MVADAGGIGFIDRIDIASADGRTWLLVYDDKSSQQSLKMPYLIGTRLHRRRARALARLQPLAAAWQERLSGGREQLELRYQAGSQLEGEEAEAPWREALLEQLRRQRPEERRLGACQVGPHRDEVDVQRALRARGAPGKGGCPLGDRLFLPTHGAVGGRARKATAFTAPQLDLRFHRG